MTGRSTDCRCRAAGSRKRVAGRYRRRVSPGNPLPCRRSPPRTIPGCLRPHRRFGSAPCAGPRRQSAPCFQRARYSGASSRDRLLCVREACAVQFQCLFFSVCQLCIRLAFCEARHRPSVGKHPGVLGAAALARIDYQRTFFQGDARQTARRDANAVRHQHKGPQIHVARREILFRSRIGVVDSANVGCAM